MDIVNEDGEIVSPEDVEFAYTREGRRVVGKEYPNPIPVEAPIPQAPHEPIWEMIRRMVLEHARKEKETESGEEMETEEEANDFETEEEFDPASPWEEYHEPVDPWPMSTAARQLEQAIAEKRNQGRIAALKEELEALSAGQPYPPPPAKPASTEPAQDN